MPSGVFRHNSKWNLDAASQTKSMRYTKRANGFKFAPEVLQVFSWRASWMWTKCKKVDRPEGKISKTTVYTQRKMSNSVNCRPPLQSINKREFALCCVWMPRRPSSCAVPLPKFSCKFFFFYSSSVTKPCTCFFCIFACRRTRTSTCPSTPRTTSTSTSRGRSAPQVENW